MSSHRTFLLPLEIRITALQHSSVDTWRCSRSTGPSRMVGHRLSHCSPQSVTPTSFLVCIRMQLLMDSVDFQRNPHGNHSHISDSAPAPCVTLNRSAWIFQKGLFYCLHSRLKLVFNPLSCPKTQGCHNTVVSSQAMVADSWCLNYRPTAY